MQKDFEIEKKVDLVSTTIDNALPVEERLTPKQKFKSALYILLGLWIFYIIAMLMQCLKQPIDTKLIFITTKEIVMNFGSLLIGFYFSKGE